MALVHIDGGSSVRIVAGVDVGNEIPGPGGYMWVPIVDPFIGGFVGILLYDNLIRKGLRRVNEPVLEPVGGVETDMADEQLKRVTT